MNLRLFHTILICSILSTSCSIKDDEDVNDNNVSLNRDLDVTDDRGVATDPRVRDSDWDGIPDILEIELGKDHLIGNFSKVSVDDFDFFELKVISRGGNGRILKKVRYREDDNDLYNLKYTPIKDKMAHNAYLNVTNQGRGEELDEKDLGVFKISNFNENQRAELNKILQSLSGEDEEMFVYIDSKFRVKFDNMKGVLKINKIKAELGFINKKGQFENLSSGEFSLEDEDSFGVEVRSTGKHEEGYSSSPAFVHREYLVTDLVKKVFEDNLDMALKIKDYEVTLLGGQKYKFEEQSKKARSNTVLYAIHTPSNDMLFFNPIVESTFKTIEKSLGALITKGGKVVSAGGFTNTATSSRTDFDLGSNDQLKESSWDIFPRSYLDKIPNMGETIMLGYFSNFEIAIGGERLISRIETGLFTDPNLYCGDDKRCLNEIENYNRVDSDAREEQLKNLRIGENVKITISGLTYIPKVSITKYAKVNSLYSYEECRCRHSDDYDCDGSDRGYCRRKEEVFSCDYIHGDLGFDAIEIEKENLVTFFDRINFITEKKGRIREYNKDFFNLYVPTKRSWTSEGNWVIEFRVTQSFLDQFGEQVFIKFPSNETGELVHGFINWRDNTRCQNPPHIKDYSINNYQIDDWVNINRKYISDKNHRAYKINIERIFKK